ncbi:MAG: tRNA-dihydrouridine synthase family protein [Nanoarchaeota archaeon]|nr:tRNA-dihydrouridine synthase family protein [Nanoarchaeota archaeon]
MPKIANINLENNLVLAPMLGVNCNAFRLLSKNHGASLVSTPMIHPDSIFNQKDKDDIIKQEKPISAQIVGKDPEKMSRAAIILEEKADIIDINLGCPDKDVLAQQSGAFLTKHPEQMIKPISKVISSVNCPVTAKIRIGWDNNSINAIEVSKKLEDLGIAAITVHGRTRKQGYTGEADWDIISEVKKAINIPIIGNGDIFEPEDYQNMLEKTNVDFVMIGRGATGNPQIFENCLRYKEGKALIEKDLKLSYSFFLEFLNYYKEYSPRDNFSEIRQHALWLLKGIKNSSNLKKNLSLTKNIESLKNIFEKEL